MNASFHRLPAILAGLMLMLPLTGCGTYIVAKTVTGTVAGAGSLVVGGAVGAVKLTGKAASKTAGVLVDVVRDEPDGYE